MKRLLMFVLGGVIVASCTFVDLNYPVPASEDNEPAEIIMKSGEAVAEAEFPYEEALAQLCLEMRAEADEVGRTVKVNSVHIGGPAEGEHFYIRGAYDPAGDGLWSDLAVDNENPFTLMFDESALNGNAEALPSEYAPVLKDIFLKVIPQDFSEVGLPVEVDFSIMEGDTPVSNEILRTRVMTNLPPGEKTALSLDLTPSPIAFVITVEDWGEEQAVNIIL